MGGGGRGPAGGPSRQLPVGRGGQVSWRVAHARSSPRGAGGGGGGGGLSRVLSYRQGDGLPAFRRGNGVAMTGRRMNEILKDLLKGHVDYQKGMITGHSFRSGVPSILGAAEEE